jgi:PAS domain-containing protein
LVQDDKGRAIDYKYIELNRALERQTTFNRKDFDKLREEEIRENEFRLKVGEGYRWFRSKDHIFKKVDGKVKQVIGLAEDVTYEILLQEKAQNIDRGSGLN